LSPEEVTAEVIGVKTPTLLELAILPGELTGCQDADAEFAPHRISAAAYRDEPDLLYVLAHLALQSVDLRVSTVPASDGSHFTGPSVTAEQPMVSGLLPSHVKPEHPAASACWVYMPKPVNIRVRTNRTPMIRNFITVSPL
jgi:hypothetical protein